MVEDFICYAPGRILGRILGLILAGYELLASQNPYPITVCSVANCRPHLSHFWKNLLFMIPT